MRHLIFKKLKSHLVRPPFAIHYFKLFNQMRHMAGHTQPVELASDQFQKLTEAAQSSTEQALSALASRTSGLQPDEVLSRQNTYGLNELSHERPLSTWKALWFSYCNPCNLLLSTLAVISWFTDDMPGTLLISSMILIASLIRFIQERRSHKAADALKALIRPSCTVSRNGSTPEGADSAGFAAAAPERKMDLPAEQLVPGDIVHLSSGDIVPADLRLISQKNLLLNQSMLTGESSPVEKTSNPSPAAQSNLLDMDDLCFMGTVVSSGSGTGIVVMTGDKTYFGVLAQRIGKIKREPTQFQKGVNQVSWLLLSFMALMAPFVLFLNGFTKGEWTQAVLFALSVAVGLTPEMLPMIVSSTLAKGAVLLSRKKVVVKRLDAIQDFGAMDILCTDKTGTLTQGHVSLSRYTDAFGQESTQILNIASLISSFQTGIKSDIDLAIIEYSKTQAQQAAYEHWQKRDELTFDFSRRRMSVLFEHDKTFELICKGALEETLAVCSSVQTDGQIQPLNPELSAKARALAMQWNQEGFRVLAIASRILPGPPAKLEVKDESALTLLGFLGFLDPPKESSAAAIKALLAHGIRIKILTGDNELVARKICAEVGLRVEDTLTGTIMDGMNDADLLQAAEQCTLFSKLSPLHKEKLVRLLRGKQHVVGFMGDGINDAPALHAADIGISVNSAADVAKDAADLILLEKNLMVLEEGVIEGRKIFINMLKYIKMTASSNFGNVFSVLIASLSLPFLPMLPLHLLVQNLLYDLSQLAIPFDNVDKELLATPRRWTLKASSALCLCSDL